MRRLLIGTALMLLPMLLQAEPNEWRARQFEDTLTRFAYVFSADSASHQYMIDGPGYSYPATGNLALMIARVRCEASGYIFDKQGWPIGPREYFPFNGCNDDGFCVGFVLDSVAVFGMDALRYTLRFEVKK